MVRLLHIAQSALLILALVFPMAATGPASAQTPEPVTAPLETSYSDRSLDSSDGHYAGDGAVLFSDDFSGDLSRWSVNLGTWDIENGQLSGVGAGGFIDASIYAGDASWTDYAFSEDVNFLDGNAGFYLRSTGHWQNEYRVDLWSQDSSFAPNRYNFVRYMNGIATVLTMNRPNTVGGNTLSPVPFTNPAHVQVQVLGSTISLYVNGTLVDSFADPTPLLTGKIGFNVIWSEHAHFDNVIVTALPAESYTVSGHVIDSKSNPISGVTVSAGGAFSATTNAAGYYTVTGVITGTYTLTPSKEGYTFTPISRTVTVPPNSINQDFTGNAAPGAKPWLLMYYISGDNGLGEAASKILNELKGRAGSQFYDIAVLYDGPAPNDSRYYWIGDQVTWISKGELDTSNPTTLVNFVNWARGMFPKNYMHSALILWDHGAITHVMGDCGDSGCVGVTTAQMMPFTSLSVALETVSQAGGPIDVLFMHNCSTGDLEAAYQVYKYADYYVASESTVSGDYPPLYLDKITASTDPIDLAKAIANNYADILSNPANYGEGKVFPFTISVARLDRLPDLVSAVSTFASLLKAKMSSIGPLLRLQVLASVQRYGLESIDLYDFARLVKEESSDSELDNAAQGVMDLIHNGTDESQGYIILNRLQSSYSPISHYFTDLEHSHGVSVFFVKPDSRRSFYAGGVLAFAAGTDWALGPTLQVSMAAEGDIAWGPMLVEYVNQVYPTATDDPEPPQPIEPFIVDYVYHVSLPLVMR